MLKILQVRLQQVRLQKYLNQELLNVQAGFRKGRGTKDQIAKISLTGLKSRCQKGCIFQEAPWREFISLPFSPCEKHYILWLMAPSLHHSNLLLLSLHFLLLTLIPLPTFYTASCDYITRPIQVAQDNLPIRETEP